MILIFDLDDTLYPEISYVESGFHAVAEFISAELKLDVAILFKEIKEIHNLKGRGAIFNELLLKHNCLSEERVKKCISVYRKHEPNIRLSDEGRNCLQRFNEYRKYLVTDGNVIVQRKKIKALGIQKYFVKTIPTYQYGLNYSKPSTLCFEKIKNWEKCSYSDMLYVGDNPHKDFVNNNKLGIYTIRILTGGYRDLKVGHDYDAQYTLQSLDELTIDFLKKIKK